MVIWFYLLAHLQVKVVSARDRSVPNYFLWPQPVGEPHDGALCCSLSLVAQDRQHTLIPILSHLPVQPTPAQGQVGQLSGQRRCWDSAGTPLHTSICFLLRGSVKVLMKWFSRLPGQERNLELKLGNFFCFWGLTHNSQPVV